MVNYAPLRHFELTSFSLSEESPIHFQKLISTPYVEPHDHEFYEIAMVLSGHATHETSVTTIEASVGDVFIVPVGAVHSWVNTKNLLLLNIYYYAQPFLSIVGAVGTTAMRSLFFSTDFFDNSSMRSVVHFKASQRTQELVANEVEQIQANRVLGQTFFVGSFLKALSCLEHDYFQYHKVAPQQVLRPVVFRLMEILDGDASGGGTPNILEHANRLGFSSEHLSRLFTSQIGISPYQYFKKRRISHAHSLLCHTDLTCTEIAYKLGFADSAHFSRMFKEFYNDTPSQVKRRVADEKSRFHQKAA